MIVAITNAESVFDYQRRAIAAALQCQVRETYGMAEIVAAASECTGGQLHLWPEAGWVEVLENNQPVVNGTPGDLVCTGLLNQDMPLIRYRVGDRGALPAVQKPCICGRALPILASVEGRIDDVLYTSDGRRIGRLDPVFKAHLPICEAQIIQESLDRVRVRYVPSSDFTSNAARLIVQQLQERMGAVAVVLEQINEVPRDGNGKFRSVICNLSQTEREYLKKAGR